LHREVALARRRRPLPPPDLQLDGHHQPELTCSKDPSTCTRTRPNVLVSYPRFLSSTRTKGTCRGAGVCRAHA
jgi:hypothetical protein